MSNRFLEPVAVADASQTILVEDAEGASEFLLNRWPKFRGPRHADAYAASILVVSGKETPLAARDAFIAAAREADILVEKHVPS